MKISTKTKYIFVIVIVTIFISYGIGDYYIKEKEKDIVHYMFSITMENNTFREYSIDEPIKMIFCF